METNNILFLEKMRELVMIIGKFLSKGIVVDDEVLNFGLLDYFCITSIMPEDAFLIVKKLLYPQTRKETIYRSKFLSFCTKYKYPLPEITDENIILDEQNVFIIHNERIVPNIDDIREVFRIFDENRIPKTDKTVYIALYRQAKKKPILPLLDYLSKEQDADKTKKYTR